MEKKKDFKPLFANLWDGLELPASWWAELPADWWAENTQNK